MLAERFIMARLWAAVALYAVAAVQGAHAQGTPEPISDCGTLYSAGQYGPYDFRNEKDKLPIVLGAHFQPYVEALVRGHTNVTPGGDIDYTLRAIPNHPNALISMMRLGEKEKTAKPRGSRYSVECWFERAIRFRPDDQVVRMIYTGFLTKANRNSEALGQLQVVVNGAKDSAFTHYNAGLLYFDLGEYAKASAQAHRAAELGLDRPELREKLKAAGRWTDSVAVAPVPSASEQSSPAAAAQLTPGAVTSPTASTSSAPRQ